MSCKYKKDKYKYECPHPNLENSDFCIFHSQDKSKDTTRFMHDLKELLSQEDTLEYKLVGFFFPKSFSKDFFSKRVFNKNTNFSGCQFSGHVCFESTIFNGVASFRDAQFSEATSFMGAEFSEDAVFIKTHFCKDVNFSKSHFVDVADLRQAEFKAEANFRDTQFSKAINCSKTSFSRDTFFEGTQVHGSAVFDSAQFSQRVRFINVQFKESTNFMNVKFLGYTDFRNACFLKGANFAGAKFCNDVAFNKTLFVGANFYGAQLLKWAFFSNARFDKDAQFETAHFLGNVEFINTTFIGHAKFGLTQFIRNVDFKQARFLKDADFKSTTFRKKVDFLETKFTNAQFLNALFEGYCSFRSLEIINLLEFKHVDTEKPERVSFRGMNMEKIMFLGTSGLDAFNLVDVTWPTKKERFLKFFHIKRRCVGDEQRAYKTKNALEQNTLAWLETLYRQLKKNFEDNRNYAEAGDFHIGEMEMRRGQLSWKNIDFYPINLYRLLSQYSENWWLAFMWVIFLVILFALFYMFLGLKLTSANREIIYQLRPSLDFIGLWFSDFLNSVIYSLKVSTLQRPADISPYSLAGKTFAAIEGILGPIQVSLFLLALRRRFKR